MSGEAWAKEILYSECEQTAPFLLRHDGAATLWLNGEKVYESGERNVCAARLSLALHPGENRLFIHQSAQIERPYSGTEFGYRLQFIGTGKIYIKK